MSKSKLSSSSAAGIIPSSILSDQMSCLDSSDPYASSWNDILSCASSATSLKQQSLLWGGRGKGGRGLSRMTVQPKDIIIPDVTLEYVSDASSGSTGSKTLLLNAHLKLLGSAKSNSTNSNSNSNSEGRVYALVGRNGCGKSTLLRRMDTKKIPGFINLNLRTMYIPQEVFSFYNDNIDNDNIDNSQKHQSQTPIQIVNGFRNKNKMESKGAMAQSLQSLEEQLETIMDNLQSNQNYDHNHNDNDDENHELSNEEQMETICNQIAILEDQLNDNENDNEYDNINENDDNNNADNDGNNNNKKDQENEKASEVLTYFGISKERQQMPMRTLSGGQKKKVLLACSLFCDLDFLLLDEPTNHLDMKGIIQLRGLIQTTISKQTSIILVSHDVELINSVATDIIHFTTSQQLQYYRGNYNSYIKQKLEYESFQCKQQVSLEKKRQSMMTSIDNLQKKKQQGSSSTASSSSSGKKLSRAINSRKKKLSRSGIEKDEKGHRWTMQKAGSGMQIGSINNLDASTRKQHNMNNTKNYKLLKEQQRKELVVAPSLLVPEKAIQFKFRHVHSVWNESLISIMDVGFAYKHQLGVDLNERGMLFDSVDLCVEEGSITCILGENQCGKSTLLQLISGSDSDIQPIEGKVQFAHNVNVSYFDQHKADTLISEGVTTYGSTTSAISLLMSLYPKKTEQDIRSELSSFGLGPQQATTYIQFLSGGERCRLCLAMLMLADPHVLILDEISNHLDPESVDALAFGLQEWNGTVLLVSHDVHLIRQLDAKCYVLMKKEGKLRYVQGGIDSYLNLVSSMD